MAHGNTGIGELRYDVHGKSMTLKQASEMSGLTKSTLHSRMKRRPEINLGDLMYPVGSQYTRKRGAKRQRYEWQGDEHTCYQLAKMAGYSSSYMKMRLLRMTVEMAMDPLIPTPAKDGSKRKPHKLNVEIPVLDVNLERNNRIKSYQRMGMSEAQMIEREMKKEKIYA